MRRFHLGIREGIVFGGCAVLMGLVGAGAAAADNLSPQDRVRDISRTTGAAALKAVAQELAGDRKMAKEVVQAAVPLAKEKQLPYHAALLLAQTAADLKDVKAAETFYRLCAGQAAKLVSTQKLLESYGGLIELFYDNKKYPDSVRVCQELLELKIDDGNKLYLLVVKSSQGDGADFKGPLTAEEFDPTWQFQGGVHRLLIQSIAKQRKYDQALKLAESFIEKNDSWRSRELKGWILNEAGKFAEAAKVYEDVIERLKKDRRVEGRDRYLAQYRYALSHVYVELKQIGKATDILEKLLSDDPESPGLHNDLGYIWADHDMKLGEAEKLIRKALALDRDRRKGTKLENRDNGAYLDSLGWVLYKQRKYKEAKDVLLKAIEDKTTQHIEIFDHLGDVYLILGERAAAVDAWRRGLKAVGDTRRDQERKDEVEKKIEKYGSK